VDLGLQDSVAVVTGASKGIGLAITRALVAEGAYVVGGAREASAELAAIVEDGRADFVQVDLGVAEGPAELVDAALARRRRVDVLVNNVGGVAPRTGGFLSVTDEQWLASINLNLMAAVRATRAALAPMLTAGKGAIVTTSSVNAFLPDPAVIDYSAAKAALANFCKSLSKEVGPHGIRVNTISPGPVATDLWLGPDGVAATVGRATSTDPAAVAGGAAAQSVTGRFTTPDEVGRLVAFLASDAAANITGADVTIDGGLITTL
jgi:NAD(P)-dependent dehydrogenase (short-subunit alcohol dehydrogenase family)